MKNQNVNIHNSLKKYEEILVEKRKDLLAREKELEKEALTGMGGEGAGEISHVRLHNADLGTETYEQEMTLKLVEGELLQLQEIEDALERIKEGVFGLCEECEEEIAHKRLEVKPEARLCIKCENLKERDAKKARGGNYHDEISFAKSLVDKVEF